jgi:hypothetical protein
MNLASYGLVVDPVTLRITLSISVKEPNTDVSSVRIFLAAEAIRELFEREVDQLFHYALPLESDEQSSQTLLRALYIHTAHLFGHVVVFLRHVALSCQAIVPKDKITTSTEPILTGSLMVGRLAWLLKTNGKFLLDSFKSCLNKKNAAANTKEMVSEDQLFSAFEIADLNGDGVVTLDEAIEVIHHDV